MLTAPHWSYLSGCTKHLGVYAFPCQQCVDAHDPDITDDEVNHSSAQPIAPAKVPVDFEGQFDFRALEEYRGEKARYVPGCLEGVLCDMPNDQKLLHAALADADAWSRAFKEIERRKLPVHPPFGSLDTEPMIYPPGNHDNVLDLDDDEYFD